MLIETGRGLKKYRQLARMYIFNRKLTWKKLWNLAGCYAQWLVLKQPVIKTFPFRVNIDPTDICNLQCPLCPVGQNKPGRDKGLMHFEDYKKIIDEISPYVIAVDFFNWGEPFLNDRVFDMIQYANGKGLVTRISSNMNRFNPDMAKKLVASKLDYLIMSIDGASQESYVQYRVGGNFDKVVGHIKSIVAERKTQGIHKPILEWQFLIMKQNEHEIEKTKQMAKELEVDRVAFRPVRCDMGDEIFISDEKKVERTWKWLPKNMDLSRYDYVKKARKKVIKYCHFPWTRAVINWNGSLSPCCAIYNQRHDFGNVFQDGFRTVWNNKNYQASRRVIKERAEGKPESVVCYPCVKNGAID